MSDVPIGASRPDVEAASVDGKQLENPRYDELPNNTHKQWWKDKCTSPEV